MTPPLPRARPRDLGVRIGTIAARPDRLRSSTSRTSGSGTRRSGATSRRRPQGRGVARTGVTAIVPFGVGELFRRRVPAGAAVLNGAGEAIGITTIDEWGVLETPILWTSSMAIGRVYDAAVAALVELDETAGDRRCAHAGRRRVRRRLAERVADASRSRRPTSRPRSPMPPARSAAPSRAASSVPGPGWSASR